MICSALDMVCMLFVRWRTTGGDNLVKGVQCYELFGGIALKNHAFSFSWRTYVNKVVMNFVKHGCLLNEPTCIKE